MTGIQVFLITGAIGLSAYYLFRIRNAILDLSLIVVFTSIAIAFILFPESTNTVANKLGVGRGADLLFYLCIVFFAYLVLKLFGRIHRLEQQLTDVVREIAKQNAMRFPEEENAK